VPPLPGCAPCADVCCDGYDADYARACAQEAGDLVLIDRLGTRPAGRQLLEVLDRVDPGGLNEVECLAYAAAVRRQQSWTDALLTRAAARFVDHRPGPAPQCESLTPGSEKPVHLGGELTPACGSYAAAEWGAATGVTTWAAARFLADSIDLAVRVPGLRAAMRAGICDLPTARLVASRTRDLTAQSAAAVEDAVLRLLPGLSRAQLERIIDTVTAQVQPQVLTDRAEQVRAKREVWIDHTADDHADIAGTLDTIDAHRLDTRLDELARLLGILQRAAVPGWGPVDRSQETWQQRRARALGLLADPDTITALVTAARAATHPGTHPGTTSEGTGSTATGGPTTTAGGGGCAGGGSGGGAGSGLRSTTVYVHVHPDGVTDLEGAGVVSLPTVRDLIGTTQVTIRPVIDLNTEIESAAYTPSDAVTETMMLRNPTCVFPHCRRPSRDCQTDHTVPWPHGPTCTCNLGPLCQHHHHIKTHGTWTLTKTAPGVFRWRSPTGQEYAVTPETTRRL
jgi:hypothetical protein